MRTRPMAQRSDVRVTGLVLAAGGSSRLGTAKQLLAYGAVPLLGHVLEVARACGFDQLLCVIGGGADEVRQKVDFSGVDVVVNERFEEGCSSSIGAALGEVDEGTDVLVLMLGDQPGVSPRSVGALLDGRGDAALAACRYEDGRGHPLAFGRSAFTELAALHGDKGVWKLFDRHGPDVVDVPVSGPIPLDIDSWADYEAALAVNDGPDV